MTESASFLQFILLLVLSIGVSYALASLLVRREGRSMPRVLLSAALATVLVHAYLILFGQGVDQFVLISVLAMLVYGGLGGLLLDWLRFKFAGQGGASPD